MLLEHFISFELSIRVIFIISVELFCSFTGAFTDDIKLPKGTTIDLTRLPGNVLQTKSKFHHYNFFASFSSSSSRYTS